MFTINSRPMGAFLGGVLGLTAALLTYSLASPAIAGTAVHAGATVITDQSSPVAASGNGNCAEVFRMSDDTFVKGAYAFDVSDRWLMAAARDGVPSVAQLEAAAAAVGTFGDASTEVSELMEQSDCADPAYADDISAGIDLATMSSQTLGYLTTAADADVTSTGVHFDQGDIALARASIAAWNIEYASYQEVRRG
jgi:hypothetical protein